LDTLNELAAALGDDPDFATTVSNAIGLKATDTLVVHLAGVEEITGIKTFSAIPVFNGGVTASTAPFTVDSAFVVANLNSSLLEGHAASYFGTDSLLAHLAGAETMTGAKRFDAGLNVDSASNVNNLVVSRNGSLTSERLSIGVDDGTTHFDYLNDESSATMKFSITNSDTESGGGASANAGYVSFVQNASGTVINMNGVASSTNWNEAYSWEDHSLAGYAQDDEVVHLAGTEEITGLKTFSAEVVVETKITIGELIIEDTGTYIDIKFA